MSLQLESHQAGFVLPGRNPFVLVVLGFKRSLRAYCSRPAKRGGLPNVCRLLSTPSLSGGWMENTKEKKKEKKILLLIRTSQIPTTLLALPWLLSSILDNIEGDQQVELE